MNWVLVHDELLVHCLPCLATIIISFAREFEGQLKHTLRTLNVSQSAFAHVAPNFLTSSTRGTVDVWDVQTGNFLFKFKSCGGGVVCAIAPLDGGLVAFGGTDSKISVWDNDKLLTFPVKSSVYALCSLPRGKFASGTEKGLIQVWDTNSRVCVAAIQGSNRGVEALLALPNDQLASAFDDNTVRVWSLATSALVTTLHGHTATVSALALLRDGNLASGSWDFTIRIWDYSKSLCVRQLLGHTKPVASLLVLPDGKLVSGARDNCVRVWDVGDGTCLHKLPATGGLCLHNNNELVVFGKLEITFWW